MSGNLLSQDNRGMVQITNLTRKLTFNGQTKAYPVYRIKLEYLFYNDQNDRIASWLSQYLCEHGQNAFESFTAAEYNDVIEDFIIQSNPASIDKTQENIKLVNQREPGVVLPSGRIIDGNRRFTCLRRLARSYPEFGWFEAVILDVKSASDRKQIKMLELAIQHGEERKVDYNPLDRLVGIYNDIVKNKLLTVDEYAESTNETVKEINKKIELACLIVEFLEHIKLPEQFYAARDYQIVSVLNDLPPLLNKCKNSEEQTALKNAVFNNIIFQTTGDGRQFLKNIRSMIDNKTFGTYIKKQQELEGKISLLLSACRPSNLQGLKKFVSSNREIAFELLDSGENSLRKARKKQIKAQPSVAVGKATTILSEVDVNIFSLLDAEEKEILASRLKILKDKIDEISKALDG